MGAFLVCAGYFGALCVWAYTEFRLSKARDEVLIKYTEGFNDGFQAGIIGGMAEVFEDWYEDGEE